MPITLQPSSQRRLTHSDPIKPPEPVISAVFIPEFPRSPLRPLLPYRILQFGHRPCLIEWVLPESNEVFSGERHFRERAATGQRELPRKKKTISSLVARRFHLGHLKPLSPSAHKGYTRCGRSPVSQHSTGWNGLEKVFGYYGSSAVFFCLGPFAAASEAILPSVLSASAQSNFSRMLICSGMKCNSRKLAKTFGRREIRAKDLYDAKMG